jgi:hypothetical protein
MNKLDKLKLKLKYLEWERGGMFHSDTIECSGYFEENETDLANKFKNQLIKYLEREIENIKKQLTLAESCDTIKNKEENQYENV